MHEAPDLIERIENWAAAQRSTGGKGPVIGSIEGRYRKHSPEASSDPAIDMADAALVNEAWKRCMPLERDILRWHYVRRAHRDIVCRKLCIKHSPPSVWEIALAKAHRAIGTRIALLEEACEV